MVPSGAQISIIIRRCQAQITDAHVEEHIKLVLCRYDYLFGQRGARKLLVRRLFISITCRRLKLILLFGIFSAIFKCSGLHTEDSPLEFVSLIISFEQPLNIVHNGMVVFVVGTHHRPVFKLIDVQTFGLMSQNLSDRPSVLQLWFPLFLLRLLHLLHEIFYIGVQLIFLIQERFYTLHVVHKVWIPLKLESFCLVFTGLLSLYCWKNYFFTFL